MRKSEIVHAAIAACSQCIISINEGTPIDVVTFDKWTEALLRNVFFHYKQRLEAQSIENLHREILLIIDKDHKKAKTLLHRYMVEVRELAAKSEDLNTKITWEPPFDRGLLSPYE